MERVVSNTVDFVGTAKTIMTHSLSSTVLNVFEKLQDSRIAALVTESRPLNEGYILARRLSEWCIPTQLITDAQMGLFAAQADMALVGADSLLADGSLLNKTGSYLLALAAQDAKIPFCV
jgi:translation initiation factor 2B subunit (eIF-2B alpha/beta/delta family)